jgi:hypothetical protein
MSGLRGWVWTVVAVAGTATAAALVYRYATRDVRGAGDEDDQARAAGRSRGGEYESLSEDDELEEEEVEEVEQQQQRQLALVSREGNMVRWWPHVVVLWMARRLRLTAAMNAAQLLSVFGLVFLLLVVMVSMVVAWSSDEPMSLAELPMFTPLVWIALGIFTGTQRALLEHHISSPPHVVQPVVSLSSLWSRWHPAATVEVLNPSSASPSGIPEKTLEDVEK